MRHFQSISIQKRKDNLQNELNKANIKAEKLASIALAYGASEEVVKRILLCGK